MASPKKLLYLHNSPVDSGAANLVQVVSMCNAFSKAGYIVTLVLNTRKTKASEGKKSLIDRWEMLPEIHLILLRQHLPVRFAKHLSHLRLGRMIRRIKPDLVFVRDPRYFRAAGRCNRPVILELHNSKMHNGSSFLDEIYKKWIIQGTYNERNILVISISEALRNFWIQQGIPKEKIISLHDGFSPRLFKEVLDQKMARKELGIQPDEKVVVYTGNLQENRGIDYIMDLASGFPEVKFILAGGSPDRKVFYEQRSIFLGMNNIRFDGQQPHNRIPLYLYAADVLLAMWSKEVPTISYCSPLKVFEYLATGIPMVIPGYPTILEVVEDQKDAFVMKPDDPEDFRRKLQMALSADEETVRRISMNARKKAIEHYTWDQRAMAIIQSVPNSLRP
jgi:glycosyltransferase involved in cell wall biosynthesis